MITIDDRRIDEIKIGLLQQGHTWAKANSMAVDIYITEQIQKEKMMKKVLHDAEQHTKPSDIVYAKRKRQKEWRNAHANV